MALEAILFYDKVTGTYKRRSIRAQDIKSTQAARDLGLFVDSEDNFMHWVRMSKAGPDSKSRRSHFRNTQVCLEKS